MTMPIEAARTLTCRQCGKEFLFPASEQEFYKEKGFTPPQRCRPCRSVAREQRRRIVCSGCGAEVKESAAVYCGP